LQSERRDFSSVAGTIMRAGPLFALLGLAGCGQGTSARSTHTETPASTSSGRGAALTRAQFIKRADAMCVRIGRTFSTAPLSAAVLRDLRSERPQPRDMPELARYTGALIRSAGPREPRFKRILVRTDDASLRDWWEKSERASDAVRAVHRTAVSRKFAAFKSALVTNAQAAGAYMDASGQLGFRSCGRAPSG
jgi:hypothetical protein